MAICVTPRIVVAATGSGVGKTTVTAALMRALHDRGLKVAAFKCGPDYLDPGYHQRAALSSSHNLDGWMMGRAGVLETFATAAADADIAIIEGVMGLFDSAAPTADEGSTAEIARWLGAPVLLVVDASGMARTIAALALGFAQFDSSIRIAGLICNRVGSRGHLELLRRTPVPMPIVGALPAAPEITLPERHLGLVSAINSATPESVFQRLGQMAVEWFDLDSIIALARSSPPLAGDRDRAPRAIARCPIGIAYDEAFHFYYQYNLAALEAAGAELVRFSPIRDRTLPAVAGLYFGGGYPETAARELSANLPMLQAIREFAAAGKPIYAECGGLMYLAEAIRTFDHETYPMAALIPGTAVMHSTLQALGYVEVTTTAPSLLGPTGTSWRGHQFRYSSLEPDAAAIERIYRVVPRWGAGPFAEGYRRANVIASYVHAHWASNPAVPAAFVQTCAEAADRRKDRFS